MDFKQKRNFSPSEAIKILAKHGTVVSIDQAKLILDFMYEFGKLALDQQIRKAKPNY